MEQFYITSLTINKVRHLTDISIPLSEDKPKHLIFTGKNGSGKTSVTDALAEHLNKEFTNPFFDTIKKGLEKSKVDIQYSHNEDSICSLAEKYHCILAYYKADRVFHAEQADEIQAWFGKLEQLLKQIFDDETVKLVFDEETFEFHILQQGKEPFDFNTLSSGYQSVLDIVLDIMMRMQHETQRSFDYHLPGIVLIDEIETHLHLELQKTIIPLLTTIFPNIQFIMTSHSPFILNSLKNVVIYDLENHILVEDGLENVPYDGIVEGYFGADKLSNTLKEKFRRYKDLVTKKKLSDDELCEIAELELYLNEIPDYLALSIATEYQKLKLEFINREDMNG